MPAPGGPGAPELGGETMSVQAFYQLAIWLPLAVPSVALLLAAVTGTRPAGVFDVPFELLTYSLVYGGIPYILVAIAATIWVDRRPEAAIRRLALRAPFWVLAAWAPLCAYVAIRAGSLPMLLGLLALGGGAIITLGYAYVALAFALRAMLGRAGVIREMPVPTDALA